MAKKSPSKNYETGSTAATVVALVAGLVIGVGGGYAITSMKKNDNTNMANNSSTTMSNDTADSQDSDGVTVGGAKMVASKDIVANAQNAKNVTTVVSLVAKAGLVETLQGPGPFTVFAPDNDAFGKLPKATVESLQQPENVATLKNILTYHVVPGTYTSADLRVMASKGESLTTVQGEKLMPMVDGSTVKLKDTKGGESSVKTADVISSNGVTHVIDTVLMP